MTSYDLALFLHLLALLAAIGASTVVHLAMLRIRSAGSGGEALQWLGVAHSLARVFPVALATLLATGAWMVHGTWPWNAGFVEAGLTGVAILFVSGGAVEGRRAGKAAAALAARPAEAVAGAAAELVRDPVWWCASFGNTGVALAVVFAMATKPAPGTAFAALAVGLCAGVATGLLARRGGAPRLGEAVRSPS